MKKGIVCQGDFSTRYWVCWGAFSAEEGKNMGSNLHYWLHFDPSSFDNLWNLCRREKSFRSDVSNRFLFWLMADTLIPPSRRPILAKFIFLDKWILHRIPPQRNGYAQRSFLLTQRIWSSKLIENRANIDELVKSRPKRHPGESRGPERLGITGFRLSPEWRIPLKSDFLQDHQH